jgi:hypothetical protein
MADPFQLRRAASQGPRLDAIAAAAVARRGKQAHIGAMQDLEAFAEDELHRALSLTWRDLAPIVPWGDTYDGVSASNLSVKVERNYLWADKEGGDILAEVAVFLDEAHHAYAARRSARIARR